MLVLSRRVGEELVISENIKIVIHQIGGKRVSIGIEAPIEVPIVRGELQAVRDSFKEETSEPHDEPQSVPALRIVPEFDAVEPPARPPR